MNTQSVSKESRKKNVTEQSKKFAVRTSQAGSLQQYSPFISVSAENLSQYLDRQKTSPTVDSIEVYECVSTLTKKVEWA